MEIKFFIFSVEAFQFSKFYENEANHDKRSYERSLSVAFEVRNGETGLEICILSFFGGEITKLFTSFLKYKRNNKICIVIKFRKSLFHQNFV